MAESSFVGEPGELLFIPSVEGFKVNLAGTPLACPCCGESHPPKTS